MELAADFDKQEKIKTDGLLHQPIESNRHSVSPQPLPRNRKSPVVNSKTAIFRSDSLVDSEDNKQTS